MAHYIDNGESTPTPTGNQAEHGETSFAARQFLAIARGELPVRKPANGFRAVSVNVEYLYCLDCYGIRWHDVVSGEGTVKMTVCRTCGKESVK